MERIILVLAIIVLITGCAQQEAQAENLETPPSPPIEDAAGQEQETSHPIPDDDPTEAEQEPVNEQEPEEIVAPDSPSNTICNKLPLSQDLNIGDKYYCLAVVNHNAEFCKNIKGDEGEELDEDTENHRNLCFAHANKDQSFCKKISDIAGKKVCYFVLSQTSGDIDFCGGIDYDSNEKELCYFSFANALYWEDKSDMITAEDCNKIPEPERSACFALKARDVSLCGSNKNCLTFFKQELSFCNSNFKEKSECIRDRALSSKDISICDKIEDKISKEDCYGDYASHISHTTSTCDKITNSMKRQGCYTDVAINLAKE